MLALVHDFFIAVGGAEKVVDSLLDLPYDFELYAAISYQESFHNHKIHTSFMQELPFLRSFLLLYKNLLPYAFESITFPENTQLVISSTASFAKFVIPPAGVRHISYIHTPPRFLWGLETSLKVRKNRFLSFLYNLLLGNSQRVADYWHAQRVHVLIANSQETALRIKKFYKRESIVINPPVAVAEIIQKSQQFTKRKDAYVVFGRVEAYKGIEKLLEVWPSNKNIVIAGTGSLLPELKRRYKDAKNITFTGFVPESEKIEYLASHKAVIYPNREDFGIVMVEALAAGTPVISINEGGALEIINDQETGILLKELSSQEVTNALNWVESQPLEDPSFRGKLQQNVVKFDKKVFLEKMQQVIEEQLNWGK